MFGPSRRESLRRYGFILMEWTEVGLLSASRSDCFSRNSETGRKEVEVEVEATAEEEWLRL
jgi:hypothetical protein